VIVVVRTPSDFAMYHRRTSPLFPALLRRLGHADEAQTVVLPRTAAHREEIRSLGLPAVTLPDGAVDAQSLIALSDLVVSAGGTMNREAAALGVPVYTTFGGRLGAVDEALVREGRLRRLADPQEIELTKRGAETRPAPRDPRTFLDLLLP
jgi:predicted glycosyltransferase